MLLPVASFRERREEASLSLASAGQSLVTPCLGHPPTPGTFGERELALCTHPRAEFARSVRDYSKSARTNCDA